MDLFGSTVIVIGPYCDEACKRLEGIGAHVHHLSTRSDAVKGLFGLLSKRIEPKAVIVNWEINSPSSMESQFYRMAKREKFNTAESLLTKMAKLLIGVPIVVHNVSGKPVPECVHSLPGVDILEEDEDPVDILLREPSIEGRRA